MEMNDEPRQRTLMPLKRGMRLKFIFSILIFVMIWSLFQINTPWAKQSQLAIRNILTEEIGFQAISAWYEHTFSGSPSFIPSFHSPLGQDATKVDGSGLKSFYKPVNGKIMVPYSSTHPSILLQTQANALVFAMESGRVLFAGTKENTGYTVIIQHGSGYQSIYGMLQPMQLKKDDWVKVGEVVGKAATLQGQAKGNIVLALMKNAEYINPTDVISFE
jgi:stage IV sporulation protein FA